MADRSGRTDQKHDPRACQQCASLRHPGTAAQGRALAAHLRTNPLPRQKGGRK